MTKTTQQQRAHHVAQMRANFAIENMSPDRGDLIMQERYVMGAATIGDLLAHAHAFVRLVKKKSSGEILN